MGSKKKVFIITLIVCTCCFLLFVFGGYLVLNNSLINAATEAEKVPYLQEKPENTGILTVINSSETYLFFNFEDEKLIVSLNPEAPLNDEIYGYPLDYTLTANGDIIGKIADYLSGLELTVNGECYRYTGGQINELIKQDNSYELKRDIIISICKRITDNGVGSDFFNEIIQNANTDLSLIDCYFWDDYMTELCDNLSFID